MMTEEQAEVVKLVYNRFLNNETDETWTGLDDNLEIFGWMSNDSLIKESQLKTMVHSEGVFKCEQDHDQQYCFAPYILEAVEIILKLHEKTGNLHKKNAYILTYYLAMSEMGLIFSSVV